MRTWVKRSLIGVGVIAVGLAVISGTTAFYVVRELDTRTTTKADSVGEFQAIRTRFGTRPPLIEITDPAKGDIRINRPSEPDGRPVKTLHAVIWDAEDLTLIKTAVPIWLMRFSSINVLSTLGITPEQFSLTVQDLERYGPGVVVDYDRPERSRILLWVD